MLRIISLALLGFSLALAACEQKAKEDETKIARAPERATEEKDDAIEELRSYANKKREEYREKAEHALKSYDEGIAKLKAKADKASAEAKKKYDEAAQEMREKQKALREQLEEFKTASVKAWEMMEKKIDAGMEDLKKLYEKARSAVA
jgi:uncharacterized phage infection (PIP) family protein YhgE